MLNIIKADLYRIFRGKGFYITTILLLAFIILQTVAQGSVQILTVNSNESEDGFYVTEATEEKSEPKIFTGTESFAGTDVLLYFLLPFIIFIAASDFSTDTAKNVLANGVSRKKYYLSKLILSCVFCFIILLLNVIVPVIIMLTASMIPDFTGEIDIQSANLIKSFLSQLFMCLAVACVGIFFVFVTKRTAAVNGAYIAFCVVPMMLIFILYQINEKLEFLFDYEVISNIRMLADIDIAESADIIRAFAIGGVYILASTIGGIMLFKKSEVK